MRKVTLAKSNYKNFQKSKMAAIFHEKIRENTHNSSNISPMWMQLSIYESNWWYKYLGETDKSPINNTKLQRIVLSTLETILTRVIFVRCGCSFRYMNPIGGISIGERHKNHQSTTPSCKGSYTWYIKLITECQRRDYRGSAIHIVDYQYMPTRRSR